MQVWCLLLLVVAPSAADFSISLPSYTDSIKQGNATSLPLIFQGSARTHLCGCLFPPCYDTTYNFTCAGTASTPLPSWFHPPYPFRNSDVTHGNPRNTTSSDAEASTGADFFNHVNRNFAFANSTYRINTSEPQQTDSWHDPLEYDTLMPVGVTCSINPTNVTCETSNISITCLIPSNIANCSASSIYSSTFPPCTDNYDRSWCGSAKNSSAWWSREYTTQMALSYGDFFWKRSAFTSYNQSTTSLLPIACYGHKIVSTAPADLSEDICFAQHKTSGEAFCNNAGFCGEPSFCAIECSYNTTSDTCFQTNQRLNFGYTTSDVGSSVYGSLCHLPAITNSSFVADKQISVPFTNGTGATNYVNVTLSSKYFAQDLDFVLTQHSIFGKSANETLQGLGMNLIHVQMAQVGLFGASLTNVSVWTALHHIAKANMETSCFNEQAKLFCSPITTPIVDECAAHYASISSFLSAGDTDTITSSTATNKKLADADSGTFSTASIGTTNFVDMLLSIPLKLSAMFEQSTSSKHADDPHTSPYLGHMLKGDFDEEDLNTTLTNELTRHSCTTPQGRVEYTYCLSVGLDSNSNDDAALVCATPGAYIVCPLKQNGEQVFQREIAQLNATQLELDGGSVELGLSCSFRRSGSACIDTLRFTNEYPIYKTLSGTCITDFNQQTLFGDPKAYCSYKCSMDTMCEAFWVSHPSASIPGQCCMYSSYDLDLPIGDCDAALPSCKPFVDAMMNSTMGTGWFFDQACTLEPTAVGLDPVNASAALVDFINVYTRSSVESLFLAQSEAASLSRYGREVAITLTMPIISFTDEEKVLLQTTLETAYKTSISLASTATVTYAFTVAAAARSAADKRFTDVLLDLTTTRTTSPEAALSAMQQFIGSYSSASPNSYTTLSNTTVFWFKRSTKVGFGAGDTYNISCSFLLPAAEAVGAANSTAYLLNQTSLWVKNLTLTIAQTTDDLYCVTPTLGAQCAAQTLVATSSTRPLGDFGKMYRVTTSTDHFIIEHLHKGEDKDPESDVFKLLLTDELQFQKGAIWYNQTQKILGGFSTQFSFQFTRYSSMCKTVQQLETQTPLYTRCEDEGADGLAFVIKGLASETDRQYFQSTSSSGQSWGLGNQTLFHEVLGDDGAGLGYSGLSNSVAIEFDTFPRNFGEPPLAHVSVHSNGLGNNTSAMDSYLASWSLSGTEYPNGFMDHKVHTARIEFVPTLEFQNILRSHAPSPHSLDLATKTAVYEPDALVSEPTQGGIYRYMSPTVGTMSVFLDDMSFPLFSFPIDLAGQLELDSNGAAMVGFTAATGRRWQQTMLLNWTFCEGDTCGQWVANKSQDCNPGITTTDYSGIPIRNERTCQFWNTYDMWNKDQSRIMPDWLEQVPPVTTDPQYVPTPTPTVVFQNPSTFEKANLTSNSLLTE